MGPVMGMWNPSVTNMMCLEGVYHDKFIGTKCFFLWIDGF